MSTTYRPVRIAQEHHVAGKGNTTMSHNLDDRQERKTLATDDQNVVCPSDIAAQKAFQAALLKRLPNLSKFCK